MKFYTVIATLAAAVLGTASSAHAAAAAATTALSGEEEAPNLRHIDEKDDRELWKRETGQDDTPPGIAKAPWKGEGPNKEEEGGSLEINLTFEHVPDNDDPAANAGIIKELLTNKVGTIEGELVVLGDVDVKVDGDDENTFQVRVFGDLSQTSLRDIKGGATTLIAGCKLVVNAGLGSRTVEECVISWIQTNLLDQYVKTLGALGFAYGSVWY